MPQDPFPSPPGDEQEPDGFPLHADEEPGPDEEGMAQGLYVCLPAGQLTLAGFCQGGASDTMAPGALLATVVEAVAGEDGAGLAGCSDDQLLGIISAARRLESRAAWTLMAATGEFARRAGTGLEGEFAADELASELHMSQQSAAGQMDFAAEVPKRLPKTFAALAAGQIHPVHLRIIEEETRILTDADAAKADTVLAASAPGKTFGELRYAARKLVLKLDPDAARKRKEAAKRDAHVRRFREESGNAGMVARELPSDEVLRVLAAHRAARPGSPRRRRPRLPAGPPGPRLPGSAPRTRQPRPRRRPRPRQRPGPAAPGHRPARPRRAPGTAPEAPEAPEAPTVPVARAVPFPAPPRMPARAWPPWSPSPSP